MHAHAQLIGVIAVFRRRVLPVTVAVVRHHGDARRRPIGQRHIEHAVEPDQAVIAGRDLGQPGESVVIRLARNDVHDPGGAVAPVQRSLRSAQDLDPLNVVEIRLRPGKPGHVAAVHVKRGGRIRRVAHIGTGNAADGNGQAVPIGFLANMQVGNHVAQHVGVLTAGPGNLLAGKCRYRQWLALQRGFPLLRGNHDFFENLLRKRGGRQQQSAGQQN